MKAVEANFDGLIGPTHNYAGLSFGNLASANNAMLIANPKEAALQGLTKMVSLANLGLVQGILPPHERPHIPTLKRLGYTGSDAAILEAVAQENPGLLRNVSAASAMWTANAGTVSPSADTADGRVHFSSANLSSMFHRSIEHVVTSRVLKEIFSNDRNFHHHAALPHTHHWGDEGAANHNRFCSEYGDKGLEVFVYGREGFNETRLTKFPARQTLEASQAIARRHGLDSDRTVFIQQNPKAIDAGAFHNDVVAVSNKNVFFYHEQAFVNNDAMQESLKRAAPEIDFCFIEVPADAVPIEDAIKSYLFNSQLITATEEGMTLILPMESKETKTTSDYLERLVTDNLPITSVKFLDVRQSMRNGGGPACLRLRVVLTAEEQAAVNQNVLLNDHNEPIIRAWIEKHYRDKLAPDDLRDPNLLIEVRTALDELTQLLGLGSVYDFQR